MKPALVILAALVVLAALTRRRQPVAPTVPAPERDAMFAGTFDAYLARVMDGRAN